MRTRRDFLIGTASVVAGATLAPSAFGRARLARRVEEILTWSAVTASTRGVVDLALGGNALLVVSDGQALVVDAKFPYLGPALRADALSAASSGTVSLLNTHHHGDHTGGNNAFVGQGRTYAHPKAIERIAAQIDNYRTGAEAAVGQASENLRGNRKAIELAVGVAENAANLKAEDFVPTDPIGGGSQIPIGSLTLDIHHFGAGHTDNDLVVHLPAENVVHTGDLVFSGLHPFFDPTGGVHAKGWIGALTSVLQLCDADTVVVPGHGPIGGRELVEKQRDYLEQLAAAVDAEIKKGTSKEDAQNMSWPFMEGLGFEQIKVRAIGAVYDQIKGGK